MRWLSVAILVGQMCRSSALAVGHHPYWENGPRLRGYVSCVSPPLVGRDAVPRATVGRHRRPGTDHVEHDPQRRRLAHCHDVFLLEMRFYYSQPLHQAMHTADYYTV